jgi:glycosyltransferase involved in cell wall biosynthesis
MPRVSVVIPAYNPGDKLRRALESVCRQTLDDWECVVVDDGGVEDLSWVDDYEPRVRRLCQLNRGVSIARNVGCASASTRWVAFLDQDDEWLPVKLERQVEAIGAASVSYTGFTWMLRDGRQVFDNPPHFTLSSFLAHGHVCVSSLLVERTALERVGGFHPALQQQQDSELFARFLANGESTIPLRETLVRVYLHDENASLDWRRAYREKLLMLDLYGGRDTRRWRELYGAQAFDAFGITRNPAEFAAACWMSPRLTARQITSRLRRRPASSAN